MDPTDAAELLPELVRQHYELLYRYAYRLSGNSARAGDLTQQTFLTAQKRLSQLRDSSAAKNWLCAILRNQYLKEERRSALIPFRSLGDLPEPPGIHPAEAEIDAEQLQAALLELPEEFRSPVILFYFQEFSYREIAAQMEVPIGTIMSRLARARALLRKRLDPAAIDAYTHLSTDQAGKTLSGIDREQMS